jgi:hypothetical protein
MTSKIEKKYNDQYHVVSVRILLVVAVMMFAPTLSSRSEGDVTVTTSTTTIMSDDEIIGCFRLLDTEGSGFVKADDLRRMLTTMGEKMSDREVDQLLEDAGGGAKVDYAKFVKKMNKAVAGGA